MAPNSPSDSSTLQGRSAETTALIPLAFTAAAQPLWLHPLEFGPRLPGDECIVPGLLVNHLEAPEGSLQFVARNPQVGGDPVTHAGVGEVRDLADAILSLLVHFSD